MARLPTAADFDRLTPQASVTNAGYTPTGGRDLMALGEGLGNVADAFMREHEKQQQEQDDLELAHVNTEMTLGYANMMSELQSDPDYKNIPNKYKQQSDKLINTLVSQVSPRNQKKIQARLLQSQAAGYDNALNIQRVKFNDYLNTDYARSADELGKKALIATSKADFDLLYKAAEGKAMAAVKVGAKSQEEAYKELTKLKSDWASQNFNMLPPEKRLEVMGKATARTTDKNQDFSFLDTKLSPDKEAQFQEWKKKYAPNDSGFDYDLRGAFLKGYTPSKDNGHFPDEFKKPNHPTFSDQSKFAKDYPSLAGSWDGETYIPPKAAPLSVRNNNPGNIRGADGQFKKFATPEEGTKAMADDLRIKVTGKSAAMKGKFGDNYKPTISNIIATWAPSNENDTQSYINTVAKESGIPADQPLTEADIQKIMPAMIKVEGGQSGAAYYAETGTIFDYMDVGDKIRALSAKDTVTQSALDNVMAANPTEFLADLSTGKYSTILNASETEKYKENAVSLINKQIKQADEIRIAQASVYNKDVYDKIQEAVAQGDAAKSFSLVSDLRQSLVDSGKSPQFADDMRAQLLRTNPYSEEEKADILIGLVDRFTELKDKGDEASIEDVARLQNDMMVARLSGVSGVGSYVNKIAPIIAAASKIELGYDAPGFGWWGGWSDPSEPYDSGYQLINDFLFKQGKENDIPLKAKMLTEFIARADKIPEDVMKDATKRDAALATISNQVIKNTSPQSKNIPLPDIKLLKDNPTPENRKYFDEIYGGGAASKVLGE